MSQVTILNKAVRIRINSRKGTNTSLVWKLMVLNWNTWNYRTVFKSIKQQSKIERKRKVPGPCLGMEKAVERESEVYANWYWCSSYNHEMTGTRNGRLGNNGTGGVCPNYSIIEIGQNIEKSPGYVRRLAVTQTNADVKNSQGVK